LFFASILTDKERAVAGLIRDGAASERGAPFPKWETLFVETP